MKSSIRFNLYLYYEKKKIANLDDLRENFNLDDILDLFKTKELQLWLEFRSKEIDKEYSKINKEIEEIDNECLKINKEIEEIDNEYSKINKEIKEIDKEYSKIKNKTEEIDKEHSKIKNKGFELDTLTDDVLMLKIYLVFFPNANIENTKSKIKVIHDGRVLREKKLKELNEAENKYKKTIDSIIPIYSDHVNTLVKIGGKEFVETFKIINLIDNNYIQLFELQCASLVQKLSDNNCYFALLGLLTFVNLRRIVLDKSDKLTVYLWKKNHGSVANFCKLFVKKYHKKNKDYGKYIKVKKINEIYVSDKSVKKIESNGEFLILNIPANCKVKNNNGQSIIVGNICKGNLKLSPSRNLNILIDNDSITRQLHYIKIR